MLQKTTAAGDLTWLLDDLVDRIVEIRHAVLLSADGLSIASSRDLAREGAEHLSAIASGLQSLARGAGRRFETGDVRQTVIEMDFGFLFVIAAGHGACLAVLGNDDADVGLVAYEMAMLVARAGEFLAARARSQTDDTAGR